MRKLAIIIGISVIVLMVFAGYQVGSRELANVELQDDLQDLSTQPGTWIGLGEPSSDQDLRMAVVRKAKEHAIDLKPGQVMVQRARSGDSTTIYLAADYTVTVKLPGFSFPMHFTPSDGKKNDSEK